jgi:hypothetical protein
MNFENPVSYPFRFYSRRVYPRVKNLRGTHFLKRKLLQIAELGMEKVDEGEPVNDFEWQNLIVLDACRLDLYNEVVDGDCGFRFTCGSRTMEYMSENFNKDDFTDVVYITGNPHISESEFSGIVGEDLDQAFESVFKTFKTDWNKEYGTVMPEKVARDAKTAAKLFPAKRKIIHFMQPHVPFIDGEIDSAGIGSDENYLWNRARRNEIKDEEIWESYKKTLEITMKEIEDLIKDLEGKTVITADHSNFVGERGMYAHPPGGSSVYLRKVPWDVRKD